MTRHGYDTDLTDAEWALWKPILADDDRRGPKQKYALREIANALCYLIATGAQWRNIPKDFPPWSTVYWHFKKWRKEKSFQELHDMLRKRIRVAKGRNEDPSAGIIDSQTVKSTIAGEHVGYDGNKKIKGRKRHLIVDTLGMIVAMVVHSASVVDSTAAEVVLSHSSLPERLELVWADKGYQGKRVAEFGRKNGIRVQVVGNPAPDRFMVAHRRWLVERTNAWMFGARRLTKDHERTVASSECLIYARFSVLLAGWLNECRVS